MNLTWVRGTWHLRRRWSRAAHPALLCTCGEEGVMLRASLGRWYLNLVLGETHHNFVIENLISNMRLCWIPLWHLWTKISRKLNVIQNYKTMTCFSSLKNYPSIIGNDYIQLFTKVSALFWIKRYYIVLKLSNNWMYDAFERNHSPEVTPLEVGGAQIEFFSIAYLLTISHNFFLAHWLFFPGALLLSSRQYFWY